MTNTRVKPSTYDSYRSNMEIHVLPALGGRPLQQLTAPMLNTLYADLLSRGGERGPLAAKTVRYIHTIVHKALADAVDAGILGAERRGACEAAAAEPEPGARRSSAGSRQELATFLRSVEGTRLEAAWRLAAMTGMRRGEVLGLRWRDVDLDQSRIAVRNAIVSVAYEVLESSPKSHQARVIDLDPADGRAAAAIASGRPIERERARRRVRRPGPGDLRRGREPDPPAELQPGVRAGCRRARACARSGFTTSDTLTRQSRLRPACR